MIPKSNKTYRFYIDYKLLNKITPKDAYPMKDIDTILQMLREARFLSKIDLSQAYYQLLLSLKSRPYTAFAVPYKGLFQFKRMPYGLTNAPRTFQKLMERIIQPNWEPYVFVYLDDIIICTNSFKEHMHWLEKVLTALKEANLQLNKEKLSFCYDRVEYSGYIIDKDGLHTNPDKIQPITEYPPPKNLEQLRKFQGMIN